MSSNVDLTKINMISNPTNAILDQKRISDLTIDGVYYIKNIFSLKTKFGRAIKVTLENEQDNIFQSFLPKRLADGFSEEIIFNILTSGKKYTLTYKGQSKKIYADSSTASLIEFNCIQ